MTVKVFFDTVKERVTVIWAIYTLLNIFILLSSLFWCISSTAGDKSDRAIFITLLPTLSGIVIFLTRKMLLHIIQIVIGVFETVLLFFQPKIMNVVLSAFEHEIETFRTGSYTPVGYYLTPIGYLTVVICLISVVISIIMTIRFKKYISSVPDGIK